MFGKYSKQWHAEWNFGFGTWVSDIVFRIPDLELQIVRISDLESWILNPKHCMLDIESCNVRSPRGILNFPGLEHSIWNLGYSLLDRVYSILQSGFWGFESRSLDIECRTLNLVSSLSNLEPWILFLGALEHIRIPRMLGNHDSRKSHFQKAYEWVSITRN